MQTDIHFFIVSRSVLLRMRNVSDKSCTENRNTHFVFSSFFFENRAVYEIMWEKYCRAGQATDDSMAHADCMMGIEDYRYKLTICNIYCFSKATVVTRTRKMLRLCVHCLITRKCPIH